MEEMSGRATTDAAARATAPAGREAAQEPAAAPGRGSGGMLVAEEAARMGARGGIGVSPVAARAVGTPHSGRRRVTVVQSLEEAAALMVVCCLGRVGYFVVCCNLQDQPQAGTPCQLFGVGGASVNESQPQPSIRDLQHIPRQPQHRRHRLIVSKQRVRNLRQQSQV
jgi:hypothetical protein